MRTKIPFASQTGGFDEGSSNGILSSVTRKRFFDGGVAHRLEQAAHNHLVVGSIPTTPTKSSLASYH